MTVGEELQVTAPANFVALAARIFFGNRLTHGSDQSRLVGMKPTLIAAEPVSAYDAKTNLSKLLKRTAQGQRFVITKHGKPVAQLIPFIEGDKAAMRLTIDKVASIRAGLASQGVTLTGILEEGESARELTHANHRY